MLTDTHCHLDIEQFDDDRDAVLARAWEGGLDRILIPALDVESCRRVLALAESDPRLYAAVGVHPNSARTWDDAAPDDLRELASHPKIVAIGEIGLDYYWDFAPKELQHPVLRAQLKLAAALQLPVVIHNRESTKDVLGMLLEWQEELAVSGNPLSERPGVLHSFSGDAKAAQIAIAANFYLGVTGPVTFHNARDLQALVSNLPLSKLLIETDAPYLTPHPYRGKRNEPAYVMRVAEKIAALKGLSLDDVAHQTGENAKRLFRW
jgi:TatD DNase family protein